MTGGAALAALPSFSCFPANLAGQPAKGRFFPPIRLPERASPVGLSFRP